MDEKTAWNKFMLTGSVYDYLNYNEIKKQDNKKEPSKFENNYKRFSDTGTTFK